MRYRHSMHPAVPTTAVLMALFAQPLLAQRGEAAAAARGLSRAAAGHLAAGDTAAAADSLLAAVRAWPRQGAYRFAAARLAAAAGRPGEAIAQLESYTRMGFGWRDSDPAFAGLAADPDFRALVIAAGRNATAVRRSQVFRTLADSTLHPEGIAFDPATGRVFVSSVRQRKVVVIEPDSRVRDFVPPTGDLDAVFGLAVDTTRRLLWLAVAAVPQQAGRASATPGGSALVAVRLEDGASVGRWLLPDTTGAHLIGDVVLAPDGGVYATDSRTPGIYRVPDDRDLRILQPTPWRHPDWRSPQGLAFSPDGRLAWLADWTTGLFRIDRATGTVTAVAAAPTDYTLGVDGLYPVGDRRLVGLQNGIGPPRVVAFDLEATGDSVVAVTVLDRHLPLATEPTLGVLVAGSLLYVANAPWAHYRADGSPDPASPFPAPVLLRLPLP